MDTNRSFKKILIKKLGKGLCKIFSKTIKRKEKPNTETPLQIPSPLPSEIPSSLPTNPAMPPKHHRISPFSFPRTQSTVLPDPSRFFSPDLLSSPLPTNSFFQNYCLNNGTQAEYIHPYLIKSSLSSLSLCSPSRYHTPAYIYQTFTADLTISSTSDPSQTHQISSYHDLSITLDLPPSLRFYLVRGSPYVTFTTLSGPTDLSISTVHAILSVTPNDSCTKYTITMNSGQTFLIYSSSPLNLEKSNLSLLTAKGFSGFVRIAVLPDPNYEQILDRFSSCYPVSGEASLNQPFSIEYKWVKKGWGELLLLAHPLHLKLLSDDSFVTILDDFKYKSIDGDLVGVVGDSWVLKANPISPTWHSMKGVSEDGYDEISSALHKDVESLVSNPITTASSYFYGKAIARAARFALIGEEIGCTDVLSTIQQFLKSSITPWLDGTFNGNGFLYDKKWGGLVTKMGASDSGADFGFGIYNDHHYHLGYFLYAIAVLAKIDPSWGRTYMPQAYAMAADFLTSTKKSGAIYTRFRCFDMWKLHSWAGGLTEFADGRNQESTSEAINAYYSAALLGLSYGDTHLAAIGSTLTAFEMRAAQTWWHVREGEGMYEEEFARENRLVGVLWNNKRDSGLWFAPPEWRECRTGIQLLPLLPITEVLFEEIGFVKDLVKWTLPALEREGVGEGWKGFVYALEGVYDKTTALKNIRGLKGFDDGNSLSNLLWWIYSRGDDSEGLVEGIRCCWYRQYGH
jgi:endo-1,3(4)-beta-glucanase